jgi:orotidine-5'-phosphate decarboxylase
LRIAIKAVKAVREAGGEVVACLAIFSYGLETAKNNFAEINCPLLTLFNYDQLLEVAIEENYLTLNYLQTLEEWRKDPFKWGERFKEKINLTEKEQKARKRLCLPLDRLNSLEEVKARVKELSPYVGLFKVGKESFTKFGPEVVKLVQSYGSNVFLDLKYHDIPNTVKGAAKAVAELGVYMFNVHASGGLEMMKAAVEGVQEANAKRKPKIIGVTVLTSIDAETLNNELRISGQVEEQVLHLANLASEAKLDGIVCSAADLKSIKDQLPADFMYITPGVKGPNTEAGYDQKRVMTPGNAIQDGSSILVVGRAITNAEDRKKAALEVLQDMARVL